MDTDTLPVALTTRSSETERRRWLNVNTAKVLSFSALTFFVFFVAEHNWRMSTVENFVMDIEQQESWAAGGNNLRRIAFLGCAIAGVCGLLIRRPGKFHWNLPMLLLVAYLVWAGISVLWSIDVATTFRRYILMLCCVIGGFGISRHLEVEQVIFSAVLVLLGFMMTGLLAEIACGTFAPHQGGHRFAGTVHPNLQAAGCSILILATFVLSRLRPQMRFIPFAVIALAFACLVLTKSRTAVGVLPVCMIVIWLVVQPPRQVMLGVMGSIWAFSTLAWLCLVTGFDPVAQYSEVLLLGRGEETGSSLTGRLPLWLDLSSYISERPWYGYGFGAFWTPRNIYDIAVGQQWTISEAHSSYVDTTLQLGLIGVGLLIAIPISSLHLAIKIYRSTRKPEYLFIIGCVIFCLIRGLTESGLSSPIGFTSFAFVAMAAHSWHFPQIPAEPTKPSAQLAGVTYE